MIRHLLVDYGEVISTPLSENTITELAALADQPRDTFLDRYWHHRLAYDLGQSPTDYWSEVLARDLAGSPPVVNRLTTIDVHGWLRLDSLTLRTQIVLHDLGAQPGEVLFIDDRADNTLTARGLGMHTITFASTSALDRALQLRAADSV